MTTITTVNRLYLLESIERKSNKNKMTNKMIPKELWKGNFVYFIAKFSPALNS